MLVAANSALRAPRNEQERYLSSFARRARLRLSCIGLELAGAQATGSDSPLLRQQGQDLLAVLRALEAPVAGCDLTLTERVFLAGQLLALLPEEDVAEAGPVTEPPYLVLAPLSAQLQTNPQPVLLSGRVLAGDAQLTRYTILRGSVVIYTGAGAGAFSFLDAAVPGAQLIYSLRAEFSNYPTQTVRQTLTRSLPVLAGVGSLTPSNEQLLALPATIRASNPLRITYTSQAQRMLLLVPAAQPQVTLITDPGDGDVDITPSFASRPLTLTLGDGSRAEYVLYFNDADFTGEQFRVDFHF